MGHVKNRVRYIKPKETIGGHFTPQELETLRHSGQTASALRDATACVDQMASAVRGVETATQELSQALTSIGERAGGETLMQGVISHLKSCLDQPRAEPARVPNGACALALSPVPASTPALAPDVATQESIQEVMRLNDMYFAFFNTAQRRLDALDSALRDPSDASTQALTDAYPNRICTQFKQHNKNMQRCRRSSLLYLAMISADRKTLARQREQLQAYVESLQICTPYMQGTNLPKLVRGSYAYMNEFMALIAKDLLCDGLITYWCVDLRLENRRILPYIIGRQLDLLDPFVPSSQRLERIRIPNLDDIVDATVQRRPTRRTGTLADSIAAAGADVLAEQAEQAARLAQSTAESKARKAAAKPLASASSSQGSLTDGSSDSGSDVEEDLYTRQRVKQAPIHRTKPSASLRRLRFAKQRNPNADAAASEHTGAPATAAPSLGRHKAKHRSAASSAPVAASQGEATEASPPPELQFSKRGADTLRRLMAPTYAEKVKKQEYQQLLNEFALLNGPSGTGYLKRIRQKCTDESIQSPGPLRFNGQSECIWFQRHDDAWVCHSFHYPHERDSTVELPKGMLHDYRNIFEAFGITG